MSGNNVTLTEQGHLVVGNVGIPAAVVPAIEAHYRAKFAAERMPEDVRALVDELRSARGGYPLDSGTVALLDRAITALEAGYSQKGAES